MKNRFRNIFLLLLDVIILVGGAYALYQYLYDSIENIVTCVHMWYEENSFVYFTTLSNIFVMGVCLIDLPIRIKMIIKNDRFDYNWQFNIRFLSAIYIIITFMIVNLVLVFLVEEPYELYEGKEIFTHVIIPILSVLTLFITWRKSKLNKKIILLTQIPILMYSIWYLIMVFVLKVWSDFYSVGFWYPYSLLIFVVMLFGLSIGIAFVCYKLKNRKVKK